MTVSKTTDTQLNRYFVALIPPEPLYAEITQLKLQMRDQFGSKAALRSPPHITLHMPFLYRKDRDSKLIEVLEQVANEATPFRMQHSGFGAFEPRVIYVNVHTSAELRTLRTVLLQQMRRQLGLDNADYKNQGFHPHMTIAFRDLKKSMFADAWPSFRDRPFLQDWTCRELWLLRHDGAQWQPIRKFTFGKML